jgi:hypothetical protein
MDILFFYGTDLQKKSERPLRLMVFPDLVFIPGSLPVPGKPEVNFAPFPGYWYIRNHAAGI